MRFVSAPYAALVVAVTVLTGGCMFDPGGCTYEVRDLALAATVVSPPLVADPVAMAASVTLHEVRGSRGQRTLGFNLPGVLPGTITSVELRDTSVDDGAAPLAVITQIHQIHSSGAPSGFFGETQVVGAPAIFDELVQLAGEGRLKLLVRRSSDSDPTLEGLFAVASSTDWNRPRCD